MNVKDSVPLGPGHSIEFGQASWDAATTSVRNRYDSSDGRFSPRGSSEIPLGDLLPLIQETAKRDLISSSDAARMIEALAASIVRQFTISKPSILAPQKAVEQAEAGAFHEAMVNMYKRARGECNYNAARFFQMVVEMGGLETARTLLHASSVSEGYTALWERGRLDLTVENLVLQPEWQSLFTVKEREIARKRLEQYGFSA